MPSVKSLLVRARISLAEAAEARKLSCEEVRLELGEVAEGLTKLSAPARRHVRGCDRCALFKKQLKDEQPRARRRCFRSAPLLMLKKLMLAKLGIDRLRRRRARRERRRRRCSRRRRRGGRRPERPPAAEASPAA